MGLDAVMLVFWATQALAVLVLVACAAFGRQWAAGAGLVVGLAIGLAPLMAGERFGSDPAIRLFGTSIMLVLLSSIVLTLAYALARRWIALALVVVIFCVPLAYLFVRPSLPLKSFVALELMSELNFLLAPIACALAGREIFVWAARLFAGSKEGLA